MLNILSISGFRIHLPALFLCLASSANLFLFLSSSHLSFRMAVRFCSTLCICSLCWSLVCVFLRLSRLAKQCLADVEGLSSPFSERATSCAMFSLFVVEMEISVGGLIFALRSFKPRVNANPHEKGGGWKPWREVDPRGIHHSPGV